MQYPTFDAKKFWSLVFLAFFIVGCSSPAPKKKVVQPKKDKREYIAMMVSPAIGINEWPALEPKKIRKYSLIPALKVFHKTKKFKFKKTTHKQPPATFHLRADLNGRYKTGEFYMEVKFEGGETYYITAKTELHGMTKPRIYETIEKLSANMAKTLIKDMRKAGMKI